MNNMSHSAKVLIPVGIVWAMMVAAVAAGGSTSPTMWGLVVAALVVAVMGSIWVSGSITETIKEANKLLKHAIAGDYSGQIRRVGEGEMGNLQDSINLLLSQLNLKADAPPPAVDTGGERAKNALDVVTANVMMADVNFNVVYANTAVIDMLREGQADIRRDLPNFNVDTIVGGSIDQFHANPQKQRQMISALTATYKSEISVGGRTYGLIATPTHDKQGTRTGTVVEWSDKTDQLRFETEEKDRQIHEQRVAAENQRVKQSLDAVTANVMVADAGNNIVYMNDALSEMFVTAQNDIRKDLPQFDAKKLFGVNMDIFHKNPAHQQGMVEGLKETYNTNIEVGGRTFGLIATPVMNESGERLGTAVEWEDKTAQLAREEEERVRAEQLAVLAAENQRVKQSLDAVTANVMVADAGNNIVYMNDALNEMLQHAETDIRKELPNFNSRKLMGVNMDVFHKNPAHQQGMVSNLKDTFSTDIEVGGRTFNLVATPVFGENNERLGTAVEWQDKTELLAKEDAERIKNDEDRRIAGENQRVKQSLDAVTANVMIADAGNNIVYMNGALGDMLRNAESDVRKELPNFNANKMLGVNMDVFHKNPSHQQRMIGDLRSTFKTEIEVGGRTFSLIANPVFDDSGDRLGTAVEWQDRTAELMVEREVESIVEAAAGGDLSQRINMQGKEGFFQVVGSGVNRLTDICDNVINDTIRVLGAMAEGKLTEKIDADYEGSFAQLKEDANATTAKFIEVVGEIQETADAVYSGSNEISAGNQSLSQRTEEQASSLEETASSMEQMTSTIKQNSDNANQANQLASGARGQAEKGGVVVQQAVTAMEEINTSSKKVADIIGVIDEIAFQTNLLALNAAVEAARAGEQGRGFAVVASEVRNLAQRSATAAKEIKELIQDSVTKVTEGGKLVDETGETLEEIVTAVKKVSDIIAEIAAASMEQTAGIEQVNQAVMQLDEMTQQNAALVEEAAATSESMSDQAQNLNELIGFFDTGTQSHKARETRAASNPSSIARISPAASRSAPSGTRSAKKTGTDDDWSEF